MKKIIFLVAILLFPYLLKAQFIHMNPDNHNLVMEKLFGGKVNSNNEVVWKPDFGEQFNFQVSDNGLCYTKIDTIFTYKTTGSSQFILFVFRTDRKLKGKYAQTHIDVPNISVALFEKSRYSLDELVAFDKHLTDCGDYGIAGDVKLVKIGKDRFGLRFFYSWLYDGIFSFSTHIYEATYLHFPKVFTLVTGGDNWGKEAKADKRYKFSSDIKCKSGAGKYDTILVLSTGTRFNEKKKREPLPRKQVYFYSQSAFHYVKKCD